MLAGRKKSRPRAARKFLVAPTGFEPATSALRGRRPKPLDDGSTKCHARKKMAGVEGVEPSHTAPETAVLPLDDTPTELSRSHRPKAVSASEYVTEASAPRQAPILGITKNAGSGQRSARLPASQGRGRRWAAIRKTASRITAQACATRRDREPPALECPG